MVTERKVPLTARWNAAPSALVARTDSKACRSVPAGSKQVTSETVATLVDRFLERRLTNRPGAFADSAGVGQAIDELLSFVLAGGKRIRACLCYWGWRGAGCEPEPADSIIAAAAALELFHAFALIHDDIMDASDTRRGRPSLHRRLECLHRERNWHASSPAFGTSVAILLGDVCLAWADELLDSCSFEADRAQAARVVWRRMHDDVFYGQCLELLAQARGSTDVEQSLRIARYKTAKYTIEQPLLLGGALAGAPPALLESYSAYAIPLGEAFQLRDDLLGAFGDPDITGKPVGDDLRQGKPTALIACAVDQADSVQAARINALHGKGDLTEAGVEELRGLLHATGATVAIEAMIESRTRKAAEALRDAPMTGPGREELADLITKVTQRER